MEDIFLEMNRHGFIEETHWTIAYSPVPDDTVPSGIGGVLGTVHDITEKIVGDRRVVALRDLGARSAEAKTAEEACSIAAETLARHPEDVPLALFYLIDNDRKHARLAGAAGVDKGQAESPLIIELSDTPSRRQPWPMAEVVGSETLHIVTDLPEKLMTVPPGPWSDPPHTAVVLPIRSNIAHHLAGLLVFGISSRLRFDDRYSGFCELVTGQVATAIANARAYEEERKRAEALEEIDRTKTAFFSNVSHEFRTPLTLMLGPLEDMLARANGSCTASREELDLVYRNGLRMLKLVNTLLDFSRIEAGRREASYEPTDLAALSAELASVFRSAIERAGLRLSVDCPPLAEPVYVDRSMWEKIVLNLMSNAFKFTFAGEIALSLRQVAQYVELSVSDTGTGIPAHEVPRLFERFHRIEGARGRTYEGSGIGLALVQELAKLHGGSVRVESSYGHGSRFTVSIPLGSAHLPAAHVVIRQSTPSAMTAAASAYVEEALRWLPTDESAELKVLSSEDAKILSTQHAAQPRVLLVDDNADMRHYVQHLLAESYEVHTARDGEAALAIARKNPPDLVLTDIMMPRLDGFGLLQALRSDPRTRSIPAILLSARAGEESRVEGLEAGANDYLIKPFSAQELRARVRNLVMIKRARDVLQQELATQNEDLSQLTHQLATSRQALLAVKDELAAELAAMTRLHELSTRLLASTDLQPLLEEILTATIALQNADFGNVQLYNPNTQTLEIVAQRGFQQDFLEYFSSVHEGTASCGEALQRRERVIVEDVQTDPVFAPHRQIAAAAGYRAVQSTPLFSRSRELLGMISTHFREPHRPSERELRLTDLYARQAAEMIERRRTEQALRASEEHFRSLVDGVKDYAIFMLAPDGRVMTWNNGAERIKGYCAQEILGQHVSRFYEQGDIQVGKPEQGLKVAVAAGQFEDEGWRVRKDGSRFWAHVVITALKDETGKLKGFAKLIRDMTERKRAEEALRGMQTELAHAARVMSMGELTASIAHEINQPLTVIITNANACSHLLAGESPDLAEVREAMVDIAAAGTRASEVIARIRALLQKAAPEKTWLDLNEVIQEILSLTRSELRTHQISVQIDLPAGLPPVLGDRVQLQQVLLNLIMNGIEAMAASTTWPRMLLIRSQVHDSHSVLVAVQDSGVGLNPQDMDRLFQTFFTTKSGGMGMGLAISRSIIEAHGGRLWAATNPGPGATFHFTLPTYREGTP